MSLPVTECVTLSNVSGSLSWKSPAQNSSMAWRPAIVGEPCIMSRAPSA
jgi:hypothetical protein